MIRQIGGSGQGERRSIARCASRAARALAGTLLLLLSAHAMVSAPANAGNTASVVPSEPIYTNQPTFAIPFHIERPGPGDPQPLEVQLHVSTDRGTTWQRSGRVEPGANHFLFHAPKDGEYWFFVRTLDRFGRLLPDRPAAPELRVVVDTAAPQIELAARRHYGRKVTAEWRILEPHIAPGSMKLQTRPLSETDETTTWQTVAIQPEPPDPAQTVHTGRVSWWTRESGPLLVRLTVEDRAGNRSARQVRVEAASFSGYARQLPTMPTIGSSTRGSTTSSTTAPSPAASSDPSAARFPDTASTASKATQQPTSRPSAHAAPTAADSPRATSAATAPTSEQPLEPSATSASSSISRTEAGSGLPPRGKARADVGRSTDRFVASGGPPSLPDHFPGHDSAHRPGPPTSEQAPAASRRTDQSPRGSLPTAGQSPADVARGFDPFEPRNPLATHQPRAASVAGAGRSRTSPRITARPALAGEPPAPESIVDRPAVGSNGSLAEQAAPPRSAVSASPATPAPTPYHGEIADRYRPVDSVAPPAIASPGFPLHLLRPGERPRMVGSRRIDVDYVPVAASSRGSAVVELWVTTDGGEHWVRYGTDADGQSPMTITLDEGLYGLLLRTATPDARASAAAPPPANTPPELWVGVDITAPLVRLTEVRQGVAQRSGKLLIHWQASDQMLAAEPISLFYSAAPEGPWQLLADRLPNTGSYVWSIPARLSQQIYLRIEARDAAGNIGVDQRRQPVVLRAVQYPARIRSVQPSPAAEAARSGPLSAR